MVSARRSAHNKGGSKKSGAKGRSRKQPLITSDMRVADIVALCDEAERVLSEFGIHCAGCSLGGMEALSEACVYHGLDDWETEELVSELNNVFAAQPKRPQSLIVTKEAACAIRRVAEEEGRRDEILLVIADGQGGFCMEFQEEAPENFTFCNEEEPDVKIQASALTLRRIGGSAIDFREGRFKLDLPEEQCADCEHDVCQCGKNSPSSKVG